MAAPEILFLSTAAPFLKIYIERDDKKKSGVITVSWGLEISFCLQGLRLHLQNSQSGHRSQNTPLASLWFVFNNNFWDCWFKCKCDSNYWSKHILYYQRWYSRYGCPGPDDSIPPSYRCAADTIWGTKTQKHKLLQRLQSDAVKPMYDWACTQRACFQKPGTRVWAQDEITAFQLNMPEHTLTLQGSSSFMWHLFVPMCIYTLYIHFSFFFHTLEIHCRPPRGALNM